MFSYRGPTPESPDHITIEYREGSTVFSFEMHYGIIDRDESYLEKHRLDRDMWSIDWSGESIIMWSDCDEKAFIQRMHRKADVCQTFSVKKTPDAETSLLKVLEDWRNDYYDNCGWL